MEKYSTKSKGNPLPKDYGIPIKFQSRPRNTMQDVMNWYRKGPNPSIDRYRIHKTEQPQKYGISRIPSYTNNNRNPLEKSYKSNNPTEKLYKNNNNKAGEQSHLNGEPAVIEYDGTRQQKQKQQEKPSAIEELIKNLREKDHSSIYENKLTKEETTEKQSTNTEHYNKNNAEQNKETIAEPKETFESALEKIRNNLDDIPEQNESVIEKQSHEENTKDKLQSISSKENKEELLSLDEITEQARELNSETKIELQDVTTNDTVELEQQQQEELTINELSDKLESLPTELFENNLELRKKSQDHDSLEYTRGENYY